MRCYCLWMYCFTVVNIILSYATNAEQEAVKKVDCTAKIAACDARSSAKRPVCGSDNQTYPSRCQLLRARCSGYHVTVKHRGPCAEAQPCFVSLNYARSQQRASGRGTGSTFVPKCRPDGTYAAVQCHPDTGCWCVNPSGVAIPNTSVRNGRPKCNLTGKSYTRRRSSARAQKNRKPCTRAEKRQFNSNLMKIFTSELERSRAAQAFSAVAAEEKPRHVAIWKFTEMDKDNSETLQKPEYRGLRRILKKVVKPKQCAKSFARTCDTDHDEIITKEEWVNCLTQNKTAAAEDVIQPEKERRRQQIDRDYAEENENDPVPVLPGSLFKEQFPEPDTTIERSDDMDSNDCLSDRKTVLDEQKNGDVLYVPECTTDGRYQRVQCYHSTGYCWCVHEDSGRPIPGSSVKDKHPECEALHNLERPMRGCPEPLKTNFLRDLFTFFLSKMITSANGTSSGSADILKWQSSREEQIATWSFVMLDKDKNKMLERREWKLFQSLVAANSQLGKCGKKLPRYCDVNHDRKISITEWLICLNAQRGANTTSNSPRTPSTSKRKGPNPLDSILKGD